MRGLIVGVFGILATLVSGVSFAQSANQASEDSSKKLVLEEVIVTARVIKENLQEVPVSITAFDAGAIEAAGMNSVVDIAELTPGFSFQKAFGRDFDRPVIRGMSNIQGEANVAFFLDGVYVKAPPSSFGLDNIERVEIIRGPQSALFGRRTFAGAINYITKKPTDEFETRVKAEVGGYGLYSATVNTSGPIVEDQLRFEVFGRYYKTDGMYRNNVTGRYDLGGEETQAVGAALNWVPNESFDATLRLNYFENDDEAFPWFRQGSELNNCYLPDRILRRRGYFCGEVPRNYDALGANIDYFDQAGFPAGLNRENFSASLVMNLNFNGYTATSTTSYETEDLYQALDQDGSGVFVGAFSTITFQTNEVFSQQFRITSNPAEKFRWLAGVYFYEEEPGDGWAGNLASFNPANPGPVTVFPVINNSRIQNRAVFAMLEYDVSDRLKLTAETRYAEDKISSAGTSTASPGISSTGWIPGSYSDGCYVTAVSAGDQLTCVNSFSQSATFDSFLPRVTATWSATEDVNVYAQFSMGNKPGGFNENVHNARWTPSARDLLTADGLATFDEEEANNYEVGMKSELLDGRMRLNLAAFYIDWSKQQLTRGASSMNEGVKVGGQPTYDLGIYNANLGKTTIKGMEAELTTLLTESWDLRLTYAYIDNEITEYNSADQSDLIYEGSYDNCVEGSQCFEAWTAAGSVAGNTGPASPKHSGSLEGTFRTPVADVGDLVWRTSYTYESSWFSQIHNLAESGDSHNVNMRLGLETDNWSATLWVNNIFEEDTPDGILRLLDINQVLITPPKPPLLTGGTVTFKRDFLMTLPPKRQFGATFTYRF